MRFPTNNVSQLLDKNCKKKVCKHTFYLLLSN